MSRYIQETSRLEEGHELYQREKKANKILILKNKGILYSFLVRDNHIYKVEREEKEDFPIGTILLGKVINVAKQFGGVFFLLESIKGKKGRTGFLQMEENAVYQPINREADGRILSGDEMPVQIMKLAKGNKPPQLTIKYSLAGAFVVIKRGSGRITYSAKLHKEEKARLERDFEDWKTVLSEKGQESTLQVQEWDITLRTNAFCVEPKVWQKEMEDLISRHMNIDRISQTRTAYSKLYEPEAFYLDFIKNQPLASLEEIVTDEKEVYETLKVHPYTQFVSVRLYEDKRISLQSVYALDTRLKELLSVKVYMKSGAYLMIEQTEALVAIDVNTGKAEKRTEPEEFYFQINLEAVKEVCYQLSARNLSGMILVDFINMKKKEHLEKLIDALKAETMKDVVQTCFIDLTRLGLAEITRKKTSGTLKYTLREWENK